MENEVRRRLNTPREDGATTTAFLAFFFLFFLFGYALLVDRLHFAPPGSLSRTVRHSNQKPSFLRTGKNFPCNKQGAGSRKTSLAKPYLLIEFTLLFIDVLTFSC